MYPSSRSPEPVVGRACSGCTLRLARPEPVEGRARSGCTCRTTSSRLVLRQAQDERDANSSAHGLGDLLEIACFVRTRSAPLVEPSNRRVAPLRRIFVNSG